MEKELDPSGEEEGVDSVDGIPEVESGVLQDANAPTNPHLELLQELEEKLFLNVAVRDVKGAVEGLRQLSWQAFDTHRDTSRTPPVTPWSLWYPFPDGTVDPASSTPPPPPKSSTQRPPPPEVAFPADVKKFPEASANLEQRRVKNLEAHAPRWLEGSGVRAWAGIGEVHTPPSGRYGDGNSELEVSANALFLLSVLASSGIVPDVVPHDEKWALEALKKAVSGGSLEAAMALGDRLVSGRGMKQNCQAGLWHLWAVADKVLTEAEAAGDFQLPREPVRLRDRERDGSFQSQIYLEDGEEQVYMEEDLAARGSAEAQRHIGYRRLLGRGLDQDAEAAFQDFTVAAAAGDEFAAFNLGYMYLKGLSVEQNLTAARKYFEAAVEKELPAAYNGLGVLHFNGWGPPQNFTTAKMLFEEGAARNDADSHFNLGVIHGSGHGVPKSESMALKSFEAASDAGHWRAPFALSTMHASGQGTSVNCSKAARLTRLFVEERSGWSTALDDATAVLDDGDAPGALFRSLILAEQGQEAAMSNVAWMLRKGEGYTEPDRAVKALEWLEQATRHGATESYVDMAYAYLDGERLGLPGGTNVTRALELHQKAADMGVLEGHYNLGWMHEKGIGMPSNLSRAGELYRHVYNKAPSEEEALTAAVALAMLNVKTLFLSVVSMLMPSSGLEEVDTSQNNLHLAPDDMQGEADIGVHHDDFSARDEGRDMQMQWDSILLLLLLLMLALVSLYWQRSREVHTARNLDAEGPDGGAENDVPEERPRAPSSEPSFCVAPETE